MPGIAAVSILHTCEFCITGTVVGVYHSVVLPRSYERIRCRIRAGVSEYLRIQYQINRDFDAMTSNAVYRNQMLAQGRHDSTSQTSLKGSAARVEHDIESEDARARQMQIYERTNIGKRPAVQLRQPHVKDAVYDARRERLDALHMLAQRRGGGGGGGGGGGQGAELGLDGTLAGVDLMGANILVHVCPPAPSATTSLLSLTPRS